MNCCPTCKQTVDASRLLVDLVTGVVSCGGKTTRLKPREAEILDLLCEAYPQTLSYEQIIHRVNGAYGADFGMETLKVHISHIRTGLKGFPLEISKFHREGYRLMMGVEI